MAKSEKRILTAAMSDKLADQVQRTLKNMKDVEMKGDKVKLDLAPSTARWEISGSYKTNSK